MTSSQKPSGRSKGRIILGFGATSDVDRSVVTAITLAKAIEREIIGLYVTEEEMVEMAGLPFTCTLETRTAQRLELTASIMSEALDRGATRSRQSLSVHAHQANVKWSFSTKSGEMPGRLCAAAIAGDYLVISGDKYGFDGVHLLKQIHQAPGSVEALVIAPIRSTKDMGGPIIVIEDGDATGEKTLSLASRIAMATSAEMIILALADSQKQANNILDRAMKLVPRGQKVTIHRLVPGATDELKATIEHLSPSFIIADLQGEPFGRDSSAKTLLRTARAPVVLLRS